MAKPIKRLTHLSLLHQHYARIVLATNSRLFSHGHTVRYRNKSTSCDGLVCNRYINLSVLLLSFFFPFVLYHVQTFRLKGICMRACSSRPSAPICTHSCYVIRISCQTQRPINVVIKLKFKHSGTMQAKILTTNLTDRKKKHPQGSQYKIILH